MSKLTSRKFWVCVASFLASLGAGLAGILQGNETLAMVGGICCVVSGAIYAACEAAVDVAAQNANQTVATTTVTATSSSQKVVEKAFSADAKE